MKLKLSFYATLERITPWTGSNLWNLRVKDGENFSNIFMTDTSLNLVDSEV